MPVQKWFDLLRRDGKSKLLCSPDLRLVERNGPKIQQDRDSHHRWKKYRRPRLDGPPHCLSAQFAHRVHRSRHSRSRMDRSSHGHLDHSVSPQHHQRLDQVLRMACFPLCQPRRILLLGRGMLIISSSPSLRNINVDLHACPRPTSYGINVIFISVPASTMGKNSEQGSVCLRWCWRQPQLALPVGK